MNVFHHYLCTDVYIYFLLWRFVLSFGDILSLFIRRIMLFFLFLYRLLYVFLSFFLSVLIVYGFLSFCFFLTVPNFVILVSGFVFISFFPLFFSCLYSKILIGFVTCENCCRQQTETARGKSLSSMELTFYLSQLSCLLKTAGNSLVQIGGNNV